MENIIELYKAVIQTRNYFVLKDFYQKTLMLETDFSDDAAGVAEFKAGAGLLRIEKSKIQPDTKTVVAFKTKSWKTAKQEFVNNHIAVSAVKVKEGKCMFEVADPDGNIIQIIEVN